MPLIMGILAQGVGAAPVGAGAYDLLETQVLGTAAASVTFTGLGSYTNYKHLQLRYTVRGTRSATGSFIRMRFNNDTGTNYADHRLVGTGGSVISGNNTTVDDIYLGAMPAGNDTTDGFHAGVLDVLDFSSASKNTTIRQLAGQVTDTDQVGLYSGVYIDTSAITDLTLIENYGDNFAVASWR